MLHERKPSMMQTNTKHSRFCLSVLLLLFNMMRVSSYHEMILQRRRTNKPRHLLRLTIPEEYKQRRRLDGGHGDKGSGGGKSSNSNEDSKEKGDKDQNDDDIKNNGDNSNNNNRDKENNENDMDVNHTDEILSETEGIDNNEGPMYVDTDPGPHSEFPNVVLSDYYNNEFVGSLGVGVPPQYFIVVFDTGSSDIWLPGEKCKTCAEHKNFDSSLSSTYSTVGKGKNKENFKISYGSGGVKGIVATDTITLSTIVLPDVVFGEVTSEDEAISSFDMDGICGLAFDGLAVITTPSLLQSVKANYPHLSQSFSMYLSSDPDDSTHPSKIIFGDYDLSIVGPSAQFFYSPIVRYTDVLTYWTVGMKSFVVGTSSSFAGAENVEVAFSVCSYGTTCLAIVDSGTSGLGIPTEYYQSVLTTVTYGMRCKELSCIDVKESDFPILLISLDPDSTFPLLPSDYVECSDYDECVVRFQQSSDFWILGDVFIEAYYTHFDVDNLRIGFACNGECSGGGWHGTGGNFVLTNDGPLWQRAVFIYAVFFLLLSAFMALINMVWSCVSGDEDEDDMLTGGRDSRYKSVSRVRRSKDGDATISANEKRQYRPLQDSNTNDREPPSTSSIWPTSLWDNASRGGNTTTRRTDLEGASNGYIVI